MREGVTTLLETDKIRQLIEMTVDQYLTTIDLVGRGLRSGQPGAIPTELAPILDRIDMTKDDLADVLTMMEADEPLRGSVAGSRTSCAKEAARRRVRYVLNAFRGGRGRRADGA